MVRSPSEKHFCPLYGREVYWSECYEVQEVREDEMDMALLYEEFDMEKADKCCKLCGWNIVSD